MSNASRVIDRVRDLADWDQATFSNGDVPVWDAADGEFVGAAVSELGVCRKYTALIGNGAATSVVIPPAVHGLTRDGALTVQLYDAVTGAMVRTEITVDPGDSTVTLTFAVAPALRSYRVVLTG